MMSTWPIGVRLFVIGAPLVLCIVSLLFSLYISRFYLDDMVSCLKNSKHFTLWATVLRNQGLAGRVLLVSKICGMVLLPGPGIRAGVLHADEIRDFPAHLRRLLVVDAALMIVIAVWMLISYALIELDR